MDSTSLDKNAYAVAILRNTFSTVVIYAFSLLFITLTFALPHYGIGIVLSVLLCPLVCMKSKTLRFLFSQSRYFLNAFVVIHVLMLILVCISALFDYRILYLFVLIAMIFYNFILADVWKDLQVKYGIGENDLFKKQ